MQPANSLTVLREGITAAKSGDTVTARALLRQATVLHPEEEQGWFWLAYVADNPDDRLGCLRQILHINPQQAQARSVLKKALMQSAAASARTGDKHKARLLLTELTELEPENEEAWLWLASVSNTFKDVADCLQRVLEINPENQRAVSWLNNSRLPQVTKSLPAWNCPLCGHGATVRSSRCSNCKAILTLAEMDAIFENDAVDRTLLQEAIDRYGNIAGTNGNHSLHFILGLAYLNLKRTEEALTHLQQASTMQPNNPVLRHQVDNLIKRIHSHSPFRPSPPLIQQPPRPVEVQDRAPRPSEISSPAPVVPHPSTPPVPASEPGPVQSESKVSVDAIASRSPIEQPQTAPPEYEAVSESQESSPQIQPDEEQVGDPYATGELDAEQAGARAETTAEGNYQQHPSDSGYLDSGPLTTGALDQFSLSRQEGAGALRQAGDMSRTKTEKVVLVVDDSPTVRKIVAVTLERHGYTVMVASGGMEALGKINEALPDLMLLDISMPNMDGYQLCKIMKGNSLTKSVPVVMLSGKDGFFDKVRGKMSGATHYITKPFEPDALVDAVHKYCKR